MKHVLTLALMLNLGVAGAYAHERSVKMTISGTSATSATDLKVTGTSNDEDHFAGDGTFGSFTLHMVRAVAKLPDGSGTCPGANQIHFLEAAGAGVFRFQDGSLLNVNLTEGFDCIDFVALQAQCTVTFQVIGGTGRFKNVSGGTLTFTETVKPVLADSAKNPIFFAATGEFTGTISGAHMAREDQEDDHR